MFRRAGPQGPPAPGWQFRGPRSATPPPPLVQGRRRQAVRGSARPSATCHAHQRWTCGLDRLRSLKKSSPFMLGMKKLGAGECDSPKRKKKASEVAGLQASSAQARSAPSRASAGRGSAASNCRQPPQATVGGPRLPEPKSFPSLLKSGRLPSPDLPLGAAGRRCWELALRCGAQWARPQLSGTRWQSWGQQPRGSPSSRTRPRDCPALA